MLSADGEVLLIWLCVSGTLDEPIDVVPLMESLSEDRVCAVKKELSDSDCDTVPGDGLMDNVGNAVTLMDLLTERD